MYKLIELMIDTEDAQSVLAKEKVINEGLKERINELERQMSLYKVGEEVTISRFLTKEKHFFFFTQEHSYSDVSTTSKY